MFNQLQKTISDIREKRIASLHTRLEGMRDYTDTFYFEYLTLKAAYEHVMENREDVLKTLERMLKDLELNGKKTVRIEELGRRMRLIMKNSGKTLEDDKAFFLRMQRIEDECP